MLRNARGKLEDAECKELNHKVGDFQSRNMFSIEKEFLPFQKFTLLGNYDSLVSQSSTFAHDKFILLLESLLLLKLKHY